MARPAREPGLATADRLAGDVLDSRPVVIGERPGPPLRLLQDVPELMLLALGQVLPRPVPPFVGEPDRDAPDHLPRNPPPCSGSGSAAHPERHAGAGYPGG